MMLRTRFEIWLFRKLIAVTKAILINSDEETIWIMWPPLVAMESRVNQWEKEFA